MVRSYHECSPRKIRLGWSWRNRYSKSKMSPEISDRLRNGENILPGYHMDKEHWISIVLERTDPEGEIYNLIEQSFHLTK